MKARRFILVFLVMVGFCAPAGQISGRVIVTRPLTKQRLTFVPYQARGLFVAAPDNPAARGEEFDRVAIYLEGEGLPAGAPVAAELRQEKRQFTERIVIVPAGSTVAFPNGDPIFHNVFSLSKAKQFDLGYYARNESQSVKFNKPGIVQVYCHIHREMNAAVVVAPSAWYGRPDQHGGFSLSEVPAGAYQLVVWHKSAGFFRRRVVVPPEGNVELRFEVPIADEAR